MMNDSAMAWIGVNRFETDKGVWTVVRVEGDSYSIREQIKAFGAFRYGFPFDLFVAFKQMSGLDSNDEFRRWLDRNADKREKRWATYFSGAPEVNAGKVRELAEGLGEKCGMRIPVRENKAVILGRAESAGRTGGRCSAAGSGAPWEPEDDGADLPF